jgi:hypothetical protein
MFSVARVDCNTQTASAPKHAHDGSKDSEFDPWGSPSGYLLFALLGLGPGLMLLITFWIDEDDLECFKML